MASPEPVHESEPGSSGAGEAPSAIAREVARARGLMRAEVYEALERLKGR